MIIRPYITHTTLGSNVTSITPLALFEPTAETIITGSIGLPEGYVVQKVSEVAAWQELYERIGVYQWGTLCIMVSTGVYVEDGDRLPDASYFEDTYIGSVALSDIDEYSEIISSDDVRIVRDPDGTDVYLFRNL